MRAGRLRHFVRAVKDVEVGTDDFGQQQFQEQEVTAFWASIEPMSGRELFENRQVIPDVTHRLVLRENRKLTADMRIEFEDRVFELLEPPRDFDERGIQQEVLCREVTSVSQSNL